ncbi:MAG: Lon protease-like protein [Gammaproteobacteria bacterium]|jgi:Lon protease-like protein
MPKSLFMPSFDALPENLPVFPLPGAILMPETQLPLNIFEPRYLSMVNDVLGDNRLIGMVQPREKDGEGVYSIGCAGRVTSFNETDDGRMIILLTGLCRFDLIDEIDIDGGYRRFNVDWQRFEQDYDGEQSLADPSRDQLVELLRDYSGHRKAEIDWDGLKKLNDIQLVNVMVCSLKLEAQSVQALIESAGFAPRAQLLQGLLEIELHADVDAGLQQH